jgi:hypothetical protein
MELLVLKESYTVTPQQLQKFIREPGLPSPTRGPQMKRTLKVKVNPTNVQPIKKPPKKKHPPQFVNKHKYYPNQIIDNENNLTDYTKTGTKQPDTTPKNHATNINEPNSPQNPETPISTHLNEMKPIQIFPTKEEAKDYTYYRYAEDDIPCHALNIIRLLLDYKQKPDPYQIIQNDSSPDRPDITRSLNNRILTSSKDLTPAKLMFGSNLHPQILTSSKNYTDPDKYPRIL